VFSPSNGASDGIIILWKSSLFDGVLLEAERFGIIVKFTYVHDNSNWVLVCVYGPCQGVKRDNFVAWLYNMTVSLMENWLLLGDFNLIQSHEISSHPEKKTSPIHLNGLLGSPLKYGLFKMMSVMGGRPNLSLGTLPLSPIPPSPHGQRTRGWMVSDTSPTYR
jgi:hypothetical protein